MSNYSLLVKRIISIAVVVLVLVGLVAFWQRQRIRNYFYPPAAVSPISQEPTAYDLLSLLTKNNLTVSGTPVIVDGTMEATVSGVLALFSLDKDLALQVRSLQLVLPRLTMEDKQVKEIDLRFDKVVLRY
ncbi:hypothetical protein M1403_01035 [Patescibacteria group bacterium]|nr:hypothetical protein [Patescibacteria group bacterium]